MDFRQRLEQNRIRIGGKDSSNDVEDTIACPYFATDRSKSPACLELRLSDGSRKAFPYSYFTEMAFDVDRGIEIMTSQKRIIVTGRNLNGLFDHLIAYRVRYVQANIGNYTEEDGLFVADILIDALE